MSRFARGALWIFGLAIAFPLASWAAYPVGVDTAPASAPITVRLSEISLSFVKPTLPPSRDLPPVLLRRDFDLETLVESRLILHGNWDGPRKFMKVSGTFRVWLEVLPWPEPARVAEGCAAKTQAYADQMREEQMRRFRKPRTQPPVLEFFPIAVRGRDGVGYRSSYDEGIAYHVIPLNRSHVLFLMLVSIPNSTSEGWDALYDHEAGSFFRSLTIDNEEADCR